MASNDTAANGDNPWIRFVRAHDQLDEALAEGAGLVMNLQLAHEDAKATEIAQALLQPIFTCIAEVRRLLSVLHPACPDQLPRSRP
jgi:hypothetical protein